MFKRYFVCTIPLLISFALAGCIYVPRTKVVDDPECESVRRSMVLEEKKISELQKCSDSGCVAVLVGAGIVSATSAVISGSIAVVGNAVYWVEREKTCRRNQSLSS